MARSRAVYSRSVRVLLAREPGAVSRTALVVAFLLMVPWGCTGDGADGGHAGSDEAVDGSNADATSGDAGRFDGAVQDDVSHDVTVEDAALQDGVSGDAVLHDVGGDVAQGGLRGGEEHGFSGAGFGEEGATLFFDGFEGGEQGNQVSGWTTEPNADVVYDQAQVYGGTQAALIAFPDGTWGNTMYLSHLDLDEVYVSYRVYVHDGGGTPHDGPQLKFARATSADTDIIHGDLSIGMTYVGAFGEGSSIWFNNGSEIPGSFYGESPGTERWARIELYLRLSEPAGAANGERWAKMDFGGEMTYSGYPNGHFADPSGIGIGPSEYRGAPLVTRREQDGGKRIQNVVMPMFTRPEQVLSVWVDEVYVDGKQARVEIGDAPDWYACKERSPQPIVSWSDDEIIVRLNRGRLEGPAYGFVVLADGTILPQGLIGSWAP